MKTKLITLLALTLCACAFLFGGTAYASAEESAETLTVEAARLEGDTLHIEVTDKSSGAAQTLTLNLRDYAAGGGEYVSVQAIDRGGNKSNVIQFKNPYYDEQLTVGETETESSVPDGAFTPDGTGSVLDDVTDGGGKEFFTIQSEGGAVYYLIVDRERTADNVYFLNAVTEQDLLSLAVPGDGSMSAVPAPEPQPVTPAPDASPEPAPAPPDEQRGGIGGGAVVFIVLAALAVGGAGYYFKIVRPKTQAAAEDEEEYGDESEEDAGKEDDFEDGDGDAE
ncbi:MAG: DUF4366 domain-containing protein [Oscillospiraceae bacterium]|jgi:hypothetical protein|nr:DUF4366 domain-containing protein [Oscillospiraceae bacterium]